MYHFYEQGQCKPAGWLKTQLRIQADGLSGNLDKIWPDVKDSAWIGGDREGWERVPYWLDGFIPLAWMLEDDELKQRADSYIESILDRQAPDGWPCPGDAADRKNYDAWALLLIGKVLTLYPGLNKGNKKGKRAREGLRRAMRCLHDLLQSGEITLFQWGKFRWFEGLIPLQYLSEQRPDQATRQWILETARLLYDQGAHYADFMPLWEKPLHHWKFETHIVNIGMMLKAEALYCRLTGEKATGEAEKLWQQLEKYNGTAVGSFTGDECLAGLAANRGTELCSIVELMYSCENLYATTGNAVWADRLEKLAFNALPATFTDDMWAHQYDQLVNQIDCTPVIGIPPFGTNGAEAHCFGLEPNYGCCTANLSQGWPKLAMSVFMQHGDGIVCAMPLPARLETVIKGVRVTVECESEYPFRHRCAWHIRCEEPVEFTLRVRIPGWVQSYTLDGAAYMAESCHGHHLLKKIWNQETVTLALEDTPHLVDRPYRLKTAQWGPLVFSLPIAAEWEKREYTANGVERRYPWCDWSVHRRGEWEFGFADEALTVEEKPVGAIPFGSDKPSVVLKANLAPIDWRLLEEFEGFAAKVPAHRAALAPAAEAVLIPYGAAKLRMTELPLIEDK